MAGEAGVGCAEYKKVLRDGPAHTAAKARIREELGDVPWYTATLATKLGLDLDDITRAILEKTRDRWLRVTGWDVERRRRSRQCQMTGNKEPTSAAVGTTAAGRSARP
jgi:hypothetical protein